MSMLDIAFRHKDVTNHVYGELKVKYRLPKTPSGESRWMCQCSCGKMSIANYNELKQNKKTSCGHVVQSVQTPKNKLTKDFLKWRKQTQNKN